LELLASIPRGITTFVLSSFERMVDKLQTRTQTPEDAAQKTSFINSLPKKLEALQHQALRTADYYSGMESLRCLMTYDDAERRCTMLSWPTKFERIKDVCTRNLLEDMVRYKAEMEQDQMSFADTLVDLQELMHGFHENIDLSLREQVALEARALSKKLEDTLVLAALYNCREVLFEVPVTDYTSIRDMQMAFSPFSEFWIVASDWQKWQKSWLTDPLHTLQAEQIERSVNNSSKLLHKARHARTHTWRLFRPLLNARCL
jgi:dynein heavy chain